MSFRQENVFITMNTEDTTTGNTYGFLTKREKKNKIIGPNIVVKEFRNNSNTNRIQIVH